jgi:hypothetical protein
MFERAPADGASGLSERLGGATIDLAAMAHFDDFNTASSVIYGVDDTELTLTNAIAPFDSSKLFTTSGPRLGS